MSGLENHGDAGFAWSGQNAISIVLQQLSELMTPSSVFRQFRTVSAEQTLSRTAKWTLGGNATYF
jgi:hypothetical protein